MQEITFGLAFVAGLLSFISPCVLPLVPAYVGYMGGRMTHTVATTGKSKNEAVSLGTRLSTLTHGLAFVLGFTFVFVSIGIATTAFVSALGSTATLVTDILARVGGVIIILFGLHFMGAIQWLFQKAKARPGLLNHLFTLVMAALLIGFFVWGFVTPVLILPAVSGFVLWLILGGALQNPQSFWLHLIESIETLLYTDTRTEVDPNKASSLSGSFLMGMVFSAGWTPCIGPIYGGILNMSLQGGSVALSGGLLATYSMGLGIPFLLTALMLDGAQNLFRRIQAHMHKIEMVSGLLLIVIGFAVATGTLQNLSQNLSTEQADFSIRVEECGAEFFRGNLEFGAMGQCVDGNLHLVAVGQRAEVLFRPDTPAQTYRFSLDEPQAIGIQFTHLDPVPDSLSITLQTRDGSEIASGNAFVPLPDTDNEYIALDIQALNAGDYDLVISASVDERTRFRVKVVRAQTIELDTSGQTGGALQELAEQGTLEIGLEEGMRAPDFTVTTLDGDTLQLSDLRGQTVLLNFWGTWCAPCIREMPELQDAYEDYQAAGFTVLGLATPPDTRDDVLAFRDEYGIEFPLALDTNSRLTNQYAVTNQPSTFIIDDSGVIVFRFFGAIIRDQIDDVLQGELGLTAE